MKKFLATVLVVSAIGFLACEQKPTVQVNTNTATSAKETNINSAKADMPKTEKNNSEYVESEIGTEKSKPESGKANVQGKVLFNEKPAANIEVRICEKFNRFAGGCDGETFKTTTDANGEYLFANIDPGVYEALTVKVFDTRNYIFAAQGFGISAAKYKFDADKTFFVPATNLFKDGLKIQNPKSGAKADAASLELKWDAYPDAAYYKVSLSPDESDYSAMISGEKVEGTSYKPTKPLKNGKYGFNLEAYNANNVKLAETPEDLEFTVTGAAGSSNDAANLNTNTK